MNVPQSQFLINQTLNSKFIEFVWQFKRTSGHFDQFICKIEYPDPMIYMEAGVTDAIGNYTDPPIEFKLGYGHLDVGGIITSPLNWPGKVFPSMYSYFANGQDLIPLIKEVREYLQS